MNKDHTGNGNCKLAYLHSAVNKSTPV